MVGRILASFAARLRGDGTDADDFFECTVCTATFDEWPGYCTDCGQLVVRITEAPTERRMQRPDR